MAEGKTRSRSKRKREGLVIDEHTRHGVLLSDEMISRAGRWKVKKIEVLVAKQMMTMMRKR